ncbi:MAG TPA: TlpA disulfide reductase family protein [Phenylobacterium sp.]|jgi:thiol-disulfide isomerase/thioredoxin
MNEQSAAKPRGGVLTWALWGAAAIGVAAVVYIIAQASINPAPVKPGAAVPTASVTHDVAKKLEHPADGTAPPAYAFVDSSGKKLTAADFKGKVVVMNLWATWCGPCKIEMPTLAKLAAAYAGKPVAVVAVSIDKPEAVDQAKAFIAGLAPLGFYNDPDAKLPWALKPPANGMPTTLLIGKDGLEHGRISGEADWSGAGAKSVIDKLLAES